ncbi:MAG: Nudix family hydrolase, partial [Luteimonas sp.]
VIRDARGRILLARRTSGRDLAGLWEFPGGKCEPDETPEQALARELHEELGIAVDIGEPLISVPQQYPRKRLCLDVRHIAAWRGIARGVEGQALAWVPLQKLTTYPMPPADRPVVAALLQPDLYLVTPNPEGGDSAWLDALQRAIASGISRVQLRAHDVEPPRWRSLVEKAVTLCRGAGIDVLINHDVALAAALGTGVHLRAAQLRELRQRPLSGSVSVASSCHTVEELKRAEAMGCDFAVLGPIRPTPTHPDARGLGWAVFGAMREHASMPLYAIGGLSPADLGEARAHGAQGIAAIRGLWPSIQ